jgi:hypothetical protein
MGDLEKVTFDLGQWSDDAELDLRRIADVTDRDVIIYRDAVVSGGMQLWEIREGGRRVGTLIWSVLTEADGATFVINAAAVRGPTRGDVTAAITSAFIAFAKAAGARSVLCWTERKGLMHKLETQFGARRKYVMEVMI